MKKVIFVFLLSLSMCLSKPAETPVAPAQASSQNVSAAPAKSAEETSPPAAPVVPAVPATVSPAATPEVTPPAAKPTDKHENQPIPAPGEKQAETKPAETKPAETKPSETKPAETKPADNNNVPGKKDDKPKDGDKVDPHAGVKNETDVKTSTEKPSNVTNSIPADKKEQTTAKPVPPTKPTEAPSKEGEKPTLQARGFDGPSFIGGIILTLGLLAIGFMGFKYYKNQTERNYHTL